VRWGMNSPLTETFYTKKEINIQTSGCKSWGRTLGTGGTEACGEQTLRNPSSTRGITERFSSMEPPLWVKGDRGCSEKQEISIARWRCPVREAG